jgi:hypothetical protein
MQPHGQRSLARQNALYLIRKEHVAVVLAMRVLEEKLQSFQNSVPVLVYSLVALGRQYRLVQRHEVPVDFTRQEIGVKIVVEKTNEKTHCTVHAFVFGYWVTGTGEANLLAQFFLKVAPSIQKHLGGQSCNRLIL